MHDPTRLGDDICRPVPTPGGFDHHLRVWAGVTDRGGEILWSVVDLARPEFLAVLIQDDDHRPTPVKINSHVMSHDGASSHRVVKASPSLTRAHEARRPLALHGITLAALLVLGIAEEGGQVLSLSEEPHDVDVIIGDEVEPPARKADHAPEPQP